MGIGFDLKLYTLNESLLWSVLLVRILQTLPKTLLPPDDELPVLAFQTRSHLLCCFQTSRLMMR
jgi:hypothetical protein